MTDAVVVPSTLALLPEYASIDDPIADVREACNNAVRWLAARHPAGLAIAHCERSAVSAGRGIAKTPGERIGQSLVAAADSQIVDRGTTRGLLVIGNGSATRTEKAPGFLDERARDFDARLVAALSDGDPSALLDIDDALAEELWCHDLPAFRALADHCSPTVVATTYYVGDPYGVQYWVGSWAGV